MNKRPTSGKAKSSTGRHRHLDKVEQRRANRGTRQAFRKEDTKEDTLLAITESARQQAQKQTPTQRRAAIKRGMALIMGGDCNQQAAGIVAVVTGLEPPTGMYDALLKRQEERAKRARGERS